MRIKTTSERLIWRKVNNFFFHSRSTDDYEQCKVRFSVILHAYYCFQRLPRVRNTIWTVSAARNPPDTLYRLTVTLFAERRHWSAFKNPDTLGTSGSLRSSDDSRARGGRSFSLKPVHPRPILRTSRAVPFSGRKTKGIFSENFIVSERNLFVVDKSG